MKIKISTLEFSVKDGDEFDVTRLFTKNNGYFNIKQIRKNRKVSEQLVLETTKTFVEK